MNVDNCHEANKSVSFGDTSCCYDRPGAPMMTFSWHRDNSLFLVA